MVSLPTSVHADHTESLIVDVRRHPLPWPRVPPAPPQRASTSENTSHEVGDVLTGLKAAPICGGSGGCCDGRGHSSSHSRVSALLHLNVASQKAPADTLCLRTDSESATRVVMRHLQNRMHRNEHDVSTGAVCHLLSSQRYTNTGVLQCVRTWMVSLPTSIPGIPRRPWEAMKIRSQPLVPAALMISS